MVMILNVVFLICNMLAAYMNYQTGVYGLGMFNAFVAGMLAISIPYQIVLKSMIKTMRK